MGRLGNNGLMLSAGKLAVAALSSVSVLTGLVRQVPAARSTRSQRAMAVSLTLHQVDSMIQIARSVVASSGCRAMRLLGGQAHAHGALKQAALATGRGRFLRFDVVRRRHAPAK